MFRPVSRTWLALDIVGAVIGFGLTVGIPLVPGSGGLSVWIVDGGWSVTAYLVVGAIVLTRKGKKEFIAPFALLVVGVHFFPLAWVFGQPILFLAAALITAAAIAAALLPRKNCAPSFWCGILGGPVFLAIGAVCALSA